VTITELHVVLDQILSASPQMPSTIPRLLRYFNSIYGTFSLRETKLHFNQLNFSFSHASNPFHFPLYDPQSRASPFPLYTVITQLFLQSPGIFPSDILWLNKQENYTVPVRFNLL